MKRKIWRKAVALLISLTMLMPVIPVTYAAQPSDFIDFPTGWSNEAVTAAVANGLLNGRTATTIEPQGNLTRAEMATIINRAFGAVKTADVSQFYDVSASDWYYTEIAKAVNMQTFQGDGTGTMRPNALITREEVFAVVARSLVLETADYSALNSHPDGYTVSDWAKPYASILSQKKYINGDGYGNLNPKSYITREEFAQIMHNIIKTYYTYTATFNQSGVASSLIRTTGVTLSDVTINGDLIIGDGVGNGTVNLVNVTITGRLLARGGEGAVTLTNTTVGGGVVVKDVNGVVHFNNYRSEAPFAGIREITKATFIGETTGTGTGTVGGGGFSGGSSGGSSGGNSGGNTGGNSGTTKYTVTVKGAGYAGNDNASKTEIESGKYFTFPSPKSGFSTFAFWVDSTDTENKTTYSPGDTCKISGARTFVPVYWYSTKHYFQIEADSDGYELEKTVKEAGYARLDVDVTAGYLNDTEYDKNNYEPNGNFKQDERKGKITVDSYKVFNLYYKLKEQTADYTIERYYAKLDGGYDVETETVRGKVVGTEVSTHVEPADDKKLGFEYDAKPVEECLSGFVSADTPLVLKVYFKRIKYNVKYDLDNTSVEIDDPSKFLTGDLQYGSTVTLPGDSDVTVSGNRVLTHWIVKVIDVSGNERTSFTIGKGESFKIGDGIAHVKDKYEIEPFTTALGNGAYVVEHWLLKLGKDVNDFSHSDETEELFDRKSSSSGELPDGYELTVSSLVENFDGFSYWGFDALSDKVVISKDTPITIKIYYDRLTYRVEFAIGSDASYVDGYVPSDGSHQYETPITLPQKNQVIKKSYRFDKWLIKDKDGNIVDEINPGETFKVGALDGGYTIEPNWKQLLSVNYQIQYMMAKLGKDITDKGNYKKNDDTSIPSSGSGLPDYTATAPELKFYGFEENAAFGEDTAIIPEDNSLVLRRYYTRKIITTNIQTGGGQWASDYEVPSSAQFGATIKLPGENDITLDKKKLDGWYVTTVDVNNNKDYVKYAPDADFKIEVETIESITPNWVDIGKVGYEITFWKLKVGGDSSKAEDYIEDTLIADSSCSDFPGTEVEAKYDNYNIYGFKPTDDDLIKYAATKGKVPEEGSLDLKLKLYYVRKDVTVKYDVDLSACSAANPDVFKSVTKEFGDEIVLPEEGSVEKEGYRLVGWQVNNTATGEFVTYNPGDTVKEIVTEGFEDGEGNKNVLTIKPVWAKLYPYYIRHYIQQLDADDKATDIYEPDDTIQKAVILGYGTDGEKVKLPSSKITKIHGFKYNPEKVDVNAEKTVTSDGQMYFEVYYDRLTIDVKFDTLGEKFVDGYSPVTSVIFGGKITLPLEEHLAEPEKELDGWYTDRALSDGTPIEGEDTLIWLPGQEVVISDYSEAGGTPSITFTAYYGTPLYTVHFMTGPSMTSDIVYTTRVPEGAKVSQAIFDDLADGISEGDEGYIRGYDGLQVDSSGYVEDAYISPTLYGNNTFVHTVKYGWYYNPALNDTYEKWTKFDSTIAITADLADDNGVVKIREKAPWLTIKADIEKFGVPVEVTRAYEASEQTLDAEGNSVTVGTRALDTFKDYLWLGFEPADEKDKTVLQDQLQSNIEKAGDKLFAKLREKGILGEDNEILDQSITVKFASIMDRDQNKDNIRKFIVDKSKESLKGSNTRLHDAILEYFKSVAESGNAEEIADLESLIENTVKGAIDANDKETTQLIEDMCEKMLEDPDVVEAAVKEIYGIDIEVDSAAMEGNAKATIIDWSEDLLNSNASLLDMALQKVPYNKYTDGETEKYHFTSANIGEVKTMEFFKTLMQKSDVTMDSLEENGITEDKLAEYIKPYVIKKVVERLGDENDTEFFNDVISVAFEGTPFEGYTRDKIASLTTAKLVSDAVSKYLEDKDIEEIAKTLGYKDELTGNVDLDGLIKDQLDDIQSFVADKTKDDSEFFNTRITPLIPDDISLKTYADFNKSLNEVISAIVTSEISASSGADLVANSAVTDMLDDKDVIESILTSFYNKLSNDKTFFNTTVGNVVDETFGLSVTSESLGDKKVGEFLKDVVALKIDGVSTADDLADLAGYSSWNAFVDANSDDIRSAVVTEIKSDNNVYEDIVKNLTGNSEYNFEKANSPSDVFGAIVEKVIADAKDGDADALAEIAKLLGKDTATAEDIGNIEAALKANRETVLEEYLNNVLGKAGTDSVSFNDYTSADEMIADIVDKKLSEAAVLSEATADMGINGDDIVDSAKATAKTVVNDKIDNLDSNQDFIIDYLSKNAGVNWPSDKAITSSTGAKAFIIEVVKLKVGTPSKIDNDFVADFGYTDLSSFFDDASVKNIMLAEVEKLVEKDSSFVAEQINEQLGLQYNETSLPATGLDLIADYAKAEISKVAGVNDLRELLGYASNDLMFDEIKNVLADKVESDIADSENGDANLLKYIKQFVPNYTLTSVEADSIKFIQDLAECELTSMKWTDIKSKLKECGYDDDKLEELMNSELKTMLADPSDDFIVTVVHALAKTEKYQNIDAAGLKTDPAKDFVVAEAVAMLKTDNDFFEDVMDEIFGFVPEDIETESTSAFITDIIVEMFETKDEEQIAKRDKMIHFATVEIVEHNHIDMLDGYIDYAIDHLDSMPGEEGGETRLDETIDEIIDTYYKDTLDVLVDELVDKEQFTIQPEDSFILEAIQGMIEEYSYASIKAQIEELLADKGAPDSLLEKVFAIYPESKLMEIYNEPYNELVKQIEDGLTANEDGKVAYINTGMTFNINPVSDIYVPIHSTNFDRFEEKAEKVFYYRENQYLRELASMTSVDTFFDGSEADGYKLKSYRDYYDLLLRLAIIGDDAINWYTEELTAEQLDELVLNYEYFFVEKANLLAELVYEYADSGEIPDSLDNSLVRTMEEKLREKFASQMDTVLEWYKTSPLYKEYGSSDYEYVRKAVNKAFTTIDITTDEVFDLVVKLYDVASGKYDDLEGVHDKIVQIDEDTYEVTFKGKTLTVHRVSDDEFEATFEGKTVKVRRHNGEDPDDKTYSECYEVSFEGNTIEISRAIRG